MSHFSFKRDKIDEILTSVNVISNVPALVTPRLQSPVTDILDTYTSLRQGLASADQKSGNK